MLQGGRITPQQAAELLEALEKSASAESPPPRARMLRINITDTQSGRTRVNVNIPMSLIDVASRLGLSLGLKQAPELADVDFDEIMAALRSGAEGKIVDIIDDDDRQHVIVSVE